MNQATSDVILDRMMKLHPKVIDLVLDRCERLLNALGNPERGLPPVIHIAGTNGKGSTQAMMRAGLEGAGKSVHAYTSPHLARFHERICVAGELITEDYLAEILDECYEANGGESITYFEITTCAALLAFARQKADFTLLEVGLGGRVDATNVIDTPALTIITPVSIDHQQLNVVNHLYHIIILNENIYQTELVYAQLVVLMLKLVENLLHIDLLVALVFLHLHLIVS